MPSFDLTSAVLLSSRMISMQSSTHSSQMNTVGPAMSLRTSCWLLPQKEQYRVFLDSPPLALLISSGPSGLCLTTGGRPFSQSSPLVHPGGYAALHHARGTEAPHAP